MGAAPQTVADCASEVTAAQGVQTGAPTAAAPAAELPANQALAKSVFGKEFEVGDSQCCLMTGVKDCMLQTEQTQAAADTCSARVYVLTAGWSVLSPWRSSGFSVDALIGYHSW